LPEPCLVVLVGAAGSGKSTLAARLFAADQILSSDAFRSIVSGHEADQTSARAGFAMLHRELDRRLAAGLTTVVDATNLRRKDRMAAASLAPEGGAVRYIVIDRPMDEKYRDAGWRAEIKDKDGQPFDLIAKHAQTFASQAKDIIAGDGLPVHRHGYSRHNRPPKFGAKSPLFASSALGGGGSGSKYSRFRPECALEQE